MSIKINILEAENTKRIKAVKYEFTANGLTVIGGKNNQGKTSVLDAIAWALGGDKYRPSEAQRQGSVIPPNIRIVMSNGLIVERKGKNGDLKVTDPSGKKGGQQLLNEFVEQLALDLPKFMQSTSKEKANTLLQIIGVGNQLNELETKEQSIFSTRQAIGRIADQKKKFAKEMPYNPDVPKEPVSASELIRQQQDILAKNGENQRKRANLQFIQAQDKDIQEKINELRIKQAAVLDDLKIAEKSALDLHDESTSELENNITDIDELNRKIRSNLDKDKAEEDALDYSNQYNGLTAKIEDVRKSKLDLLGNADLPLPDLSVVDGDLTYKGFKWDNMSGSDQLKVSTAIVRKLNPNCGFVLLDKLEQMDIESMKEFGQWLEQEGLQVIGTRVSTGDECSIVIEDGYVVGADFANGPDYTAIKDTDGKTTITANPQWKAGEF